MSGSKVWVRLVLRITSIEVPSSRTSAVAPSVTRLAPKLCQDSATARSTSTCASMGAPPSGPALPPNRSVMCAPSPAARQKDTAIGSQIVATATSSMPRSSMRRRMSVPSPATPPPGLSQTSAITTGLPGALAGQRRGAVEAGVGREHRHGGLAAQREDLAPEPLRERHRRWRIAIGDDKHLRAHLRHVGRHEAVDERNREDAVLSLQRLRSVDEAAHRLAAGRIETDHAAIEGRHHRPDLASQGAQRQIDDVLAALVEIRVRKLEERRQDVGVGDPLPREMAVRVEFGGDQHVGPDERAHALQEIALAIEHSPAPPWRRAGRARRRRPGALRELRRESRRAAPRRPAAAAVRPARPRRPCPRRGRCRSAAARRRSATITEEHSVGVVGMLARRRVEGGLETRPVGRDGRERVGFGGERGGEDAHHVFYRMSGRVRTSRSRGAAMGGFSILRAASTTLMPSLAQSRAKDALTPGPAPTITAVSCWDIRASSPFTAQAREGVSSGR